MDPHDSDVDGSVVSVAAGRRHVSERARGARARGGAGGGEGEARGRPRVPGARGAGDAGDGVLPGWPGALRQLPATGRPVASRPYFALASAFGKQPHTWNELINREVSMSNQKDVVDQ
ncbi:Protein of unknown function [Gryllus bimaculatus]|nr:Protein of unknown function [Gryllus bimaculatus]